MSDINSDWKSAHATDWAKTILKSLDQKYPSSVSHLIADRDDCDVTPDELHPAFWGSLDWHSSVHMQWSAVTLLEETRPELPDALELELERRLNERLEPTKTEYEADYLRSRPGFERPYGWGWVASLAAASKLSTYPNSDQWLGALEPLVDIIFGQLVEWLPRVTYPVRSGTHHNTAFGLGLLWDSAMILERSDVVDAIANSAWAWFGEDRDYPVAWEPSGQDFLSGALCEATLMQRVMDGDEEFDGWVRRFLPGLGHDGDPLLQVPIVSDPADGTGAHLFGLSLSRAWQLRQLAPDLGDDVQEAITQATQNQIQSVLEQVSGGDFMSTHWLVTYALQAVRSPHTLAL